MLSFIKSKKTRLKSALDKINSGDLNSGMDELRVLVLQDYHEAEYWLGHTFEFVLKNVPQAAIYYEMAANNGHAMSQWCIANLYMTGKDGVSYDPKRAIDWYHEAAKSNIPEAQFALGESYRNGIHLEVDIGAALHWYRLAAKNRLEIAITRIQQFWPDGITYQARNEILGSQDQGKAGQYSAGASASLHKMILDVALQNQYIPADELPFIPELRTHQKRLVEFTCSNINEKMKTEGFDNDEMAQVFVFIFRRAFDIVYLWHKAPDGRIDFIIAGMNPLTDDPFIHVPPNMRDVIESFDAPKVICNVMLTWWAQHHDELRKNGVDIWVPLSLALSTTFEIAVSIALKVFGYRK